MNPNDDKTPITCDLFFAGEIGGKEVKSAFQLLTDTAHAKDLKDWAAECGLPVADIEKAAKDFTSYGKQAVAEFYRGPVQHTNGYYNGQALITLNILIGNAGWKGGLQAGGGHWHEMGDKADQPFQLKKLYTNKTKAFGVASHPGEE